MILLYRCLEFWMSLILDPAQVSLEPFVLHTPTPYYHPELTVEASDRRVGRRRVKCAGHSYLPKLGCSCSRGGLLVLDALNILIMD